MDECLDNIPIHLYMKYNECIKCVPRPIMQNNTLIHILKIGKLLLRKDIKEKIHKCRWQVSSIVQLWT